jgi:hypothetical protein
MLYLDAINYVDKVNKCYLLPKIISHKKHMTLTMQSELMVESLCLTIKSGKLTKQEALVIIESFYMGDNK